MKYMMSLKPRKPVEENWNRALEINDEREKKGEGFVANNRLVARYVLLSEFKIIQIVDAEDPSIIAKWTEAYRNVLKYKISPIMTIEEYQKAMQ
jgi:hypothetical protein